MLTLNHVSYIHSNGDVLFNDLAFTINRHEKIALTGNNGSGKSTLLKLLTGRLRPSRGLVSFSSTPYYSPQHFGQYNDMTIGQALAVDVKIKSLKEIIEGRGTEADLAMVNDDWLVEERCHEALAKWGLEEFSLDTKMSLLSGGQKTKVFLAGIDVHQPEMVLLDEPSNHLDQQSRRLLYAYIQSTSHTLVVVSHDRMLLNLLNTVCELQRGKLSVYGGNYDFYAEQKRLERDVLIADLRKKEKELRKAKEIERETLERKQKLDARGKRKQVKSGLPTIMLNTLRNAAEKSTSQLKGVHAEKIKSITNDLNDVRTRIPQQNKIKVDLDNASLHDGKKLVDASNINFHYHQEWLWQQSLTFTIASGQRLAIKGNNGSGKSTLIKLILGELEPQTGTIVRIPTRSVVIDQEYSLINNALTVYEQVQQFNFDHLQEHELKIRLNRFLFSKGDWDKPCHTLSGGEKMRLMLCCLMVGNHAPDMIVLDEPTNNLDIQNIEILTNAISEYQGTLIVVSHDERFLEDVSVSEGIVL